ncbi:ABC transporter substrate-binding protein [Candidatus Sumerlaeota bacterium]|nr:ABC transporter substrate-binding protein [Candidatus Sumerlaeota bacterium]
MLASIVLIATLAPGEEFFPKEGWKDKPNPLASPNAQVGGEMVVFAGQFPNSLNYYLDQSMSNADVFGSMFESLLATDPMTMDYVPALANRWSISEDKKTFTFWIDPKATWSDGRPVTAEDVKWTFETVLDPKNLTGPFKVGLETFEPPVILDERTVRFTNREVHWRNLGEIGGLVVMPKHAYGNQDFNLVNLDFPVVSGPYRIGEIKEGTYVVMERREDYWNRDAPSNRGTGNFQRLKFKFFAERQNAYEAFKKGEIDYYPVYTSRIWVQETAGEPFDKNWIVKQKVTTHEPTRLQGYPMNMRKPPFDDVRVRKAMALLFNRYKMNETIMYSQYKMHKAYYEDLYDADHPCPREPLPFDKEAARKLLAEAGWTANPQTGILEKDGQPFVFRMLERDPSFSKFNAVYAEDLKDVGIEMIVDQKDWASWVKDMDAFNFQITSCAWGSAVRKDPEPMWSSKEAERPSGTNYPGFKNARVDELTDKQRAIFDLQERNGILREIERIVYDDHPYVLSWYADYTRLLYWNKFGTPPTVLSKYGDERAAYWYWWYDPDGDADLQDAMASGRALPAREYDIQFDEKFKE